LPSGGLGGYAASVGGRAGDTAVGDIVGVVVVWQVGTNGAALGLRLDMSSPAARIVDCIIAKGSRECWRHGGV